MNASISIDTFIKEEVIDPFKKTHKYISLNKYFVTHNLFIKKYIFMCPFKWIHNSLFDECVY